MDGLIDEVEESKSFPEELTEDDIFVDINRSVKVIELIGQILRNRYGSLQIGQLKELAESAYFVGLRFLHFYLDLVSSQEKEIVGFVRKLLESDEKLSDEELTNKTREFYLKFCYTMTFSVIKKISESTGHEKIISILDEVSRERPNSIAIKLINLFTKLEFTKKIPKKYLTDMMRDVSGNIVADRILRETVVQHLYLHHVSYSDKQWISQLLGLSMNDQRLIDVRKETKLLNK